MCTESYVLPACAANRYRVARRTIYRLIDSGALRAIRVGGSWRIPVSAIAEFEAANSTVLPAGTAAWGGGE